MAKEAYIKMGGSSNQQNATRESLPRWYISNKTADSFSGDRGMRSNASDMRNAITNRANSMALKSRNGRDVDRIINAANREMRRTGSKTGFMTRESVAKYIRQKDRRGTSSLTESMRRRRLVRELTK